MQVSESTIKRWLADSHYMWGRKTWCGSSTREHSLSRVTAFIYRFAQHQRDVNAGKAVFVGTDECYAQQSLGTTKSWVPAPSSGLNAPRMHTGTGPECGDRINVLHAMTPDGMLPGADLVFHATKRQAELKDYHTAYMGNDTWLKWLQDQLIPSFQRAYPGKQMVLLLDNVNYHQVHGPDWITPSSATRERCAEFLRARNIASIPGVVRGQPTVHLAADYHRAAKPGWVPGGAGKWLSFQRCNAGPLKKDLRAAVAAHLQEHPQQTEVQRVMKAHGHVLLYTPPYFPQLQPIESLWGIVKGVVRKQYTLGRSWQTTLQQIKDALAAITSKQSGDCFHQTRRYIDEWISKDEELLQYGPNLEALAKSPFIPDQAPVSADEQQLLSEEQQQTEMAVDFDPTPEDVLPPPPALAT